MVRCVDLGHIGPGRSVRINVAIVATNNTDVVSCIIKMDYMGADLRVRCGRIAVGVATVRNTSRHAMTE